MKNAVSSLLRAGLTWSMILMEQYVITIVIIVGVTFLRENWQYRNRVQCITTVVKCIYLKPTIAKLDNWVKIVKSYCVTCSDKRNHSGFFINIFTMDGYPFLYRKQWWNLKFQEKMLTMGWVNFMCLSLSGLSPMF